MFKGKEDGGTDGIEVGSSDGRVDGAIVRIEDG
jgi:hypothetical protein